MADVYHSDLLRVLSERGFIHQCTDGAALDNYLKTPRRLYIGFDATADSLHVGSLLPLMVLRWARKCGHHVIVVLGGGTTLVGDPSGKDQSRKMLNVEQVQQCARGIMESMGRVLDVEGPDIDVVNNADWLRTLSYIDFLRDVGAHFSINKMLSFESVKRRLDREQNLSFLEFNYMLCQAYDFLVLSEQKQCFLQCGGSDQWGNIVNGVDLIRRKTGQQAYGLTLPLLETSDGRKMGKTAQGAVWLHPNRQSPYEYWQYWRNIHDGDCQRWLHLFTELSLGEIQDVVRDDINKAKRLLADEAVRILHGADALGPIHQTVEQVVQGAVPFTVKKGADGGDEVVSDLPTYVITRQDLSEDPTLAGILASVGALPSKGQARRLMRDGGCWVNQERVSDELYAIRVDQAVSPYVWHVRLGKKTHLILQVVE